MPEPVVGAGGWAVFSLPGERLLSAQPLRAPGLR